MNGFYTERNYLNNDDYSNIFSTKRINQNSVFRNFLIDENIDDSRKKFFAPKKKEILPYYSNIKEKIENGRKDIRANFNIEKTLFRDIQKMDLVIYSQFAKKISEYFFGPTGLITENNINLKKYHSQRQKKKKAELDNKIYAGNWLFLDENPNYVRYIARLKNNRKQILNIGGNFSTEDDFTQKLHDIYLKGSKKKKQKSPNEEKIPEKNIFEFTTIGKSFSKRKSSFSPKKLVNKGKINNLLLNMTLNPFENNKYSYSRKRERNKTMYNINSYRNKQKIMKIKNIFKKERLFEKEIRMKKKYFSNLKLTINKKINLLENPLKDMEEKINLIRKGNRTINTFEENKDKYREDIKVIGEIGRKNEDENIEDFIKKTYNYHLETRKKSIPKKIFFTYIEKKGNPARESLINFVKNIEKEKELERKLKYGKSIRDQFNNNNKLIKRLGKELEELKIKKKLLFDE